MNNNLNNSRKSSIGLLGFVQISLIAIKLFGNVDLPWVLVFTPIYVELGLSAAAIGGYLIALKVAENKNLRMKKKIKRKAIKKAKIYHRVKSDKEQNALLEAYKNDTLSVQSMVLEGASNQDIIELKSSKEYKEQESNKNSHDSEIKDIVDYINMNVTLSNSERKKLLLKFKKAYTNNNATLAPIKYAENIADANYKEKKPRTRQK